MRKERFPTKWRSKLNPTGDRPFQVLERIGDSAYKIDLPGEYQMSASFNVSDLSPFDMDTDSRTNLFEEGGIDASTGMDDSRKGAKPKLPVGLITRTRAKKIKSAFQSFMGQFLEERLGGPTDNCIKSVFLFY